MSEPKAMTRELIEREEALGTLGVVCGGSCFHESCAVRRRIAQHLRSLPAAVPVVDVEKARSIITSEIGDCGPKLTRAVLDAGYAGSVSKETLRVLSTFAQECGNHADSTLMDAVDEAKRLLAAVGEK